jgi:hypothetical protein
VLSVLFVVAAVEARASSYLFRLTEQEIDEVMSHYYPKGYDRDAVLRQMSEPFDCANFGDLCREVGEDYAVQMLETVWSKARRKTPIAIIDRAAEQQFEDLSLRWFERLYPDGVPEKDPYWGVPAAAAPTCSDTIFVDSGDFRIKKTSRRREFGFLVWGRIQVDHFKRNIFGKYNRSKADRLEVSGTVFTKEAGFDPVAFPVSDTKDDVKQVAASHTEGGLTLVSVPFVEGCGGVPSSALFACTCSGIQPF